MHINLVAFLLSIMILAGCSHTQSISPEPAVVNYLTPTMKAEIQQAIVSIQGGSVPDFSDDTFTNSNQLVVGHSAETAKTDLTRSTQYRPHTKRFLLQKREVGCVLYHPDSKRYILLKSIPCKILNKE